MLEQWHACHICGMREASLFRELRVLRTRDNFLRDVVYCRVCHSGSWHVAKRAVRDTLKRAVALCAFGDEVVRSTTAEERKDILHKALDYVMTLERGATLSASGKITTNIWGA